MSKKNNYFRVGHETYHFDDSDLVSVTHAFEAACLELQSYKSDKDVARPRISVFRRLLGHLARVHQIGDFF